MCVMGITDFAEWLRIEMKNRGISQAELSRLSGISPAQISKYLSLQSSPSEEGYVAIAKAMKIPLETVFRAADLLPPLKEADPLTKEAEFILSHLSQKRRQQAIEYIKYLAQLQDQEEEELSNVVRKQGMGKTQLQKP